MNDFKQAIMVQYAVWHFEVIRRNLGSTEKFSSS